MGKGDPPPRHTHKILKTQLSNDLTNLPVQIGKGWPLFRCGRGKPPYLVHGYSLFFRVPRELVSPRGK